MSGEAPNEAFRTKVRSLISLIDRLRNLEIDQDVNLPAVAVIGDQSAGKSSVLEAISGVQLPRGTGIVTRCPLEMRMYQIEPGKPWQGRITFESRDGQRVQSMIPTCDLVGKTVWEAQKKMTGDDSSISDKLITLEVASPDVPNLTLIDLPGIARVVAHGQQRDLEESIKNLLKSYIKRQSTIILAVVQCNIDIATCEAIKLAEEFDKGGCRTLGVLTKPDLVDPGAEQEVMKVMDNVKYHLTKGYFMVKCRGQNAVNQGQSLKDALSDESTFFRDHNQFKRVSPSRRGIEKLSGQLSVELTDHIQKLLPKLQGNVRDQLYETTQKLSLLGSSPNSMNEKRTIALRITSDFCEVLKAITRGDKVENEVIPKELSHFYNEAREVFKKLYDEARNNSPDRSSSQEQVKQGIRQNVEKGRGRELIDYAGRFEYVERYAKQFILKLHRPAAQCLDTVHDQLNKVSFQLADLYFGRFPNFARKAKEVITKNKSVAGKRAREEIDRYFAMEGNFVFTQDANYMAVLYEEETLKDGGVAGRQTYQVHVKQRQQAVANASTHDVEKLFRSLVSYYTVAMRRLCDHVPLMIHQHLFHEEVRAICEQLNSLMAGDAVVELITEQEDIAQKRREYIEKQQRLHKAVAELEQFETLGGADVYTGSVAIPGFNY